MDPPVSKRLLRDFKNLLEEGPSSGIFIKENAGTDNLTHLRMMLVGPSGPYENCLFFFDVTFPKKYPIFSPTVLFQCPYTIRCHPNLYMQGKVCLSILGTWSGPPWTPMMTLNTIAQTILSILDDEPLRNEPGYVNSNIKQIQPYTDYVQYVCLKESVDLYRQCMTNSLPAKYADFADEILQILTVNREKINEKIVAINVIDTPVKPVIYGNVSYNGKKHFIEPI
jgi:ubiquitin-protein ligase